MAAVMYNVLILTSDLGFGHRSASNAIRDALNIQHEGQYRITIVNPMDHPKVPSFYRDSPETYDLMVKKLPDLYSLTYRAVDSPLTAPIIENVNTTMLLEAMFDIIADTAPHVIVVTRENYLSALWGVRVLTRKRIPIITVITDLGTVHRMWFNSVAAITCVPNQYVYNLGLAENLSPAQLRITGLAVHPRLALETRSQMELRAVLGWSPDRKTVLVVGSSRVRTLLDVVRVLNHAHFPIQLAIVAGGDEAVYAQLQAMEWHVPTHLYLFVDTLPQMLLASDVLVCKAGGLIVTEGLAGGLPLLLIDAIEGQETGNVEVVVAGGAGAFVRQPLEMLETLYDWFADDFRGLQRLAQAARQMGNPRASFDIAALVHGYASGTLMLPLQRRVARARRAKRNLRELRNWLVRLLNDNSL